MSASSSLNYEQPVHKFCTINLTGKRLTKFPYNQIHALLLSWADDDLQCANEVQHLTKIWSSVYSNISRTPSDILLSDSCNAAGVSSTIDPTIHNRTSGGGNIERIAACVFDSDTFGPGPLSFSNAFVQELRCKCDWPASLSASSFHAKALARMMRAKSPPERASTPIHILLSGDTRKSSILLKNMNFLWYEQHLSGIPFASMEDRVEKYLSWENLNRKERGEELGGGLEFLALALKAWTQEVSPHLHF